MFRFLKNLFAPTAEPRKGDQSFIRSVHYHMVDRRQYQRVVYPAVGAVGSLPAIQCDGHFLDPINISVGGILLQNPTLKNLKIGTQYVFKLSWNSNSREISQKAQLIRVYKNSWHFKFVEVERRYLAEFPRIFKTGIRGATTLEFRQNQIPPGEHIVELWMSEQGDYAIFQKPPNEKTETVTLHLDGSRYRLLPGKGLFLGLKNSEGNLTYETPVGSVVGGDILVFLVNFKHSTPRIRRTISDLIDFYYRTKNSNESQSA